MNKLIVLAIFLIITLIACKTDEDKKTEMQNKIEQMVKTVYGDTINYTIDNKTAKILLNEYEKYAATYPDDSISPYYVFMAAHVCVSLQQYSQAVEHFNLVHTKYPEYKNAPMALFLEASVLADHLNNFDLAKERYQMFLNKYPKHEMYDDAEFSMNNIGKNPEELLQEIMKKNNTAKQDSITS